MRFDALESRLGYEWEDMGLQGSVPHKSLLRDLGYLGVDMGSLRGFYSDSIAEAPEVPCRTSAQTVVRDAVHVALAANWQDAGWAAAQVWPDGLPMAAESMGRMSQRDPVAAVLECGEQLRLLDSQGRPVWAGASATPDSRRAGSVGGAHPTVRLIGRLWGQTPTRLRGPPDAQEPGPPPQPRLVVEGSVAGGGGGRRRRVLAPGPALGAAARRGRCLWSWCCWCRCWC